MLVTSPTRHAPRSMCGVAPPILRTSAPTVLSNSQPLAPRNVNTCTGPSMPPYATHAAVPATPTARNAPSAAPGPPHDEHGYQHDGPEFGEARDRDRCPARVLMSTADERDTEHGEEHGEEIEPEVDERIEEEGKADHEVGDPGAPSPRPRDDGGDRQVEDELRPHEPHRRRPERPAVDHIDRSHHDRRVFDGEVAVRLPVMARDLVEAAGVTGKDAVLARRGGVGRERHGDDGEAQAGQEQEEEQEAPTGHRCHLTDRG